MDDKTRGPGLSRGIKERRRADGSAVFYWVAASVTRAEKAKEYPQKTVRLHGDAAARADMANRLTGELLVWLDEQGPGKAPIFDGTLRGLIRNYRLTPESPYHAVQHNTRRMYDESLDLLDKTFDAKLAQLNGLDFRRWYNMMKKPIAPGKPERQRRAFKAMQLLRIAMKFGVVCRLSHCKDLADALTEMDFSAPPARKEQLTFAQATAICDEAIKRGRLSIAVAQALQFELTMRQSDVIGQWEPAKAGQSGIIDRGQLWTGGVSWSHIGADGILRKITGKTGAEAVHDTTAYPFLTSILAMVPPDKRIGPMVIDEGSGLPYRQRHFIDIWRQIADAVGVPRSIWNRDSRAGGVTEGSDAGADIEHLRHHATHANLATTGRYNRQTVEKTRAVAHLRVAHRAARND